MDLKKLSKETHGFTGADLNALISQAKLSALEESLTAVSEKRKSVNSFFFFFLSFIFAKLIN